MNGYEKIINTIRSEARKNGKHTISLKIGVMTSPKSCKIGQIELDKDDIYVSEHLTKKVLNKLDFQIESSGGTSHTHKWTDRSEYFSPLNKVLFNYSSFTVISLNPYPITIESGESCFIKL